MVSIFLLFFLAYSQQSQTGCLYHTSTWYALTANLECRFEMYCTRLAENTGRKNSPSAHHRTTLSGYMFATKTCIDNRKKNLLNSNISSLHMSSEYSELPPTNGWDRLASLGHSSKCQRISRVGFVTAPMSPNGRQPNFARCLAVSWAVYI